MKTLLIKILNFYSHNISPLSPPRCKYYPSCSAYARDAINIHGAAKGSALSAWRLLRCNPFSRGGIDYVKGSEASYPQSFQQVYQQGV